MKIQWTLLIALLFALITTIFAVVNVEQVTVNYVFGESSLPLILVIVTSTLLGGLIVGSFGIVRQYKLQRHIAQLEKQLREAHSGEAPSTLLPSDADQQSDHKLVH